MGGGILCVARVWRVIVCDSERKGEEEGVREKEVGIEETKKGERKRDGEV